MLNLPQLPRNIRRRSFEREQTRRVKLDANFTRYAADARDRATQIAKAVKGVSAVDNQLTVGAG